MSTGTAKQVDLLLTIISEMKLQFSKWNRAEQDRKRVEFLRLCEEIGRVEGQASIVRFYQEREATND